MNVAVDNLIIIFASDKDCGLVAVGKGKAIPLQALRVPGG
jgi:hypothetical protein